MEYDPNNFDPKTQFIKRRNGKAYVFDRQILLWRKRNKRRKQRELDAKSKAEQEDRPQPKIINIFE